ncbi:MAG: maleylpyruvate isomerase family mycothiol-dependent enzyme [Candidatus Dormiibacterota bacterium]
MIARTVAVDAIPALGHDEAMRLAEEEYDRLLTVVDRLRDDDWSRQTDCIAWDVKAMLGHVLGMLELQSDAEERMRQIKTAAEIAAQTGGLRLDAMTALQVREHASLTRNQLRQALHEAAPRGLAVRRATTAEQRAAPYVPGLPGEAEWTFGYLFDVIHTRDPWIHRIDISRAIGREVALSADHDGRIVADVVADWARRHGQPFTLTLTGPAGGCFTAGPGGAELEVDAVEFCRILSGREPGAGLLATRVTF